MKVKVTYRLSVVLAERRIKTATAFAKLMTEYGYSLSTSQATRYLNEGNNAPALSLGFVEAACTVLRCSPGDLYEVVIYHEEGEACCFALKTDPGFASKIDPPFCDSVYLGACG